ncbi:preprotein translocase subunit SecA [Cryomorphaceae bacterium 1068]|nr:preprotein translocase subunit SecA [Cryomorphaceae bacterium 1068]
MLGSVTKTLKKLFGDKSEKDVKAAKPLVDKTKEFYEQFDSLTHDQLRAKTNELKAKIKAATNDLEKEKGALQKQVDDDPEMEIEKKEEFFKQIDDIVAKTDDKIEEVLLDILPEAFAVVKQTAKRFKENERIEVTATDFDRDLAASKGSILIDGEKAIWKNSWLAAGSEIKWDMVHYDVQLIGGIALHEGKVAEMQTGEGKTLVATLPVYLNALTGKGVHLVTVNDYLARRDSEWMGPIYEFHGLSVDCIDKHQPNSDERRKAYKSDITFGTNNEFGFDYLRDNMASSPDRLVQRKHHYAIVDEVDSVLIDDARTPLIISGPTPKGDEHLFNDLKPKVEKLYNAQKKLVTGLLAEAKKKIGNPDEKSASKEELNEGSLSLFRAFRGLPKNKALIKYLSQPGIKQLLLKTEGYYLQDNEKEMPKADAELYFTIDEKSNGIELTEKGTDLISSNTEDADFFILPDMGTLMMNIDNAEVSDEEKVKQKDELMRNYSVKAERIHTINQLLKSYSLFEKDVDYVVMDNKVKIVDEQTGRIMEGRRYSDGLHQAIESKENVKIEDATQTYATVTLQNYFRMYHKLSGMTGTAETEAGELWDIYKLDVMIIPTNRPIAREDREDKVYKTKREKYNASIDEIVELSKAGRPVLVGTTSVEVSEFLSRSLKMRGIEHNVLNAKLHAREADVVAEAGRPSAVTIATNMAGRGTDIKLREGVKEAGGLAIVGTEKHDSRRVDRQLRGRAGRQGDPGSSQFYISLEDDLMRLFGSDRIAKMMDRLGLEEGEVIQHSMITKSIERAQRKVEENNFGIRKRLLEYDDVMNSQREVIYKRRKHALFGDRLELDIQNMFRDLAEQVVINNQEAKDYEGFKMDLLQYFGMDSPISEDDFVGAKAPELTETIYKQAREGYKRRMEAVTTSAMPVIKQVHQKENNFENIAIPFSDGKRSLQIVANIEKCLESEGKILRNSLEKSVTLSIIDNEWKEHLREMDDLRQSVQNARFEQKDPLLIYKFESFELFKKMIGRVSKEVVSFLSKAALPGRTDQVQTTNRTTTAKDDSSRLQTSRPRVEQAAPSNGRQGGPTRQAPPPPVKTEPVRAEKKIGRNDPCPCGSGKKYKQCHGKAVSQV